MHPPTVSILIPSFHSSPTIGDALKSAASQTIPHEIVVVDGGSGPEVEEAIRASGVHPDVLICEPDRGVYDAINKGLARASGTWIYVLGADDVLASPTALEQLITGAPPDAQLLLGDIVNFNGVHRGVPRIHRSSLSEKMLWRNTIHQQGAVYHRGLFDSFRFDPSLRILGDYAFHLHLHKQQVKWHYAPVLVARCEARGLSKQFTRALYREEHAIKRHLPWYVRNAVWLKYLLKNFPFSGKNGEKSTGHTSPRVRGSHSPR